MSIFEEMLEGEQLAKGTEVEKAAEIECRMVLVSLPRWQWGMIESVGKTMGMPLEQTVSVCAHAKMFESLEKTARQNGIKMPEALFEAMIEYTRRSYDPPDRL